MKWDTQRIFIATVFGITFSAIGYKIYLHREVFSHLHSSLTLYRQASQTIKVEPTRAPEPIPKAEPTTAYSVKIKPNAQPTISEVWGVAKKVDDMTYTIKVGEDERMATPQEILDALNQYRRVNGKSALTWDDKLAGYAQTRAQHFSTIAGTDKHAGFDDYLNNHNGFEALGYRRVGENSYFGGKLNGVHMIEWVFAKSPGHDANQLDDGWTYVGIGVTNNAANLNFGGDKM